jgi:hypothetical protein
MMTKYDLRLADLMILCKNQSIAVWGEKEQLVRLRREAFRTARI